MTAATARRQDLTMSRRERKKLETRRRMYEAAMSLMGSRGYANVKIEEICEAADVANATFFLHFPTKAALITAFNEDVSAKIVGRLGEIGGKASQKLKILRDMTLEEWAARPQLMRELVLELVAQPSATSALSEANTSLVDLIQTIVVDGQSNGEFARDLDPAVVALSLASAWTAITVSWARTGDREAARAANQQALELVLRGLALR